MSIFLRVTWQPVKDEIWQFLVENKYDDIIFTLLEFYYDFQKIDTKDKSDILNNIELASQEFLQILPFESEQKCIQLLEGFYNALKENHDEKIANEYENNLKKIFEKYNLRYTIMANCRIGLSIQGILDSMLLILRKEIKNNPMRQQTIEMLEENIMKLENTPASIRNCLIDANNLIEGAVIDKSNTRNSTLGAALSKCPKDMFAHKSLKSAFYNLYTFYSDQPNIRHAGVPPKAGIFSRIFKRKSSKNGETLRDLKTSDAVLSTALAISFASFVRTRDDGKSILDGDL